MSWQQLLTAHRVQRHTSRHEPDGLRAVIERRAMRRCRAVDDRQFATAYNAVLQLAGRVIARAGYRVVGRHHVTTFEAGAGDGAQGGAACELL
jgi:hypothetical protein